MTLTETKKCLREKYETLANHWLKAYDIKWCHGCKVYFADGQAWADTREIDTLWPITTTYELFTLAHEIGHVSLGHTEKHHETVPFYATEWEAEIFARAMLRKHGIPIPKSHMKNGPRYIQNRAVDDPRIQWALRLGQPVPLDPVINKWMEQPYDGRIIPEDYHTGLAARIKEALAVEDE